MNQIIKYPNKPHFLTIWIYKQVSIIALFLSTTASAQLMDVDRAPNVPEPVFQCACNSSAAGNQQFTQTYAADSLADLMAVCPTLENKAFAISDSRGVVEGVATTTLCAPRVWSRSKLMRMATSGPVPQAIVDRLDEMERKVQDIPAPAPIKYDTRSPEQIRKSHENAREAINNGLEFERQRARQEKQREQEGRQIDPGRE